MANPNVSIDDDDRDDAEDVSEAASDESPEPAEPLSASADSIPAPMNPEVSAYLKNKQAMQSAQQVASQNQLYANLGRAFGGLANSTYGHTGQNDTRIFDALDKSSQAPVQQEAEREAVQGQDPNSDLAKQLRKIYKPIFEKAGLDTDALDDLGADEIKAYAQNPLEFMDKQKTLEANKQLALKTAETNAQSRNDLRQQAMDMKATDAQSKAYTTMRKDLESFRGNQSVQQAAIAVQNSDKALALVNSKPTSQNLALLADEMGKIASGGVPGEHGVQALLPNNLNTKVAEIQAWVTGHPNASAADVTEYLDNNREYINQVRGIAAQALHSYRSNIAKGYRARVSPDQFQEASDDYSLGAPPVQPMGPAAPMGGPAPASAPPGLVARKTSDGRTALFDANKNFVRYQ